jgi:hypothetical protein
MLPPFVPPSARASSESLPLITEFVIDRAEHSFGSSFDVSGGSVGISVETLPSIDEFVREAVQSEVPQPVDEGEHHELVAHTRGEALEADLMLTEHRTAPSGAEDAIVNEMVEPADAWAASTAGPATGEVPVGPVAGAPASGQVASEVWMAEERDAFDWHSVANLAVPPAEDQRAAEEWSSTEWERSSGSVQDHVAALLAQISRRIRAGELEVQGSKQMGSEAALVAALAALLGEGGKQ